MALYHGDDLTVRPRIGIHDPVTGKQLRHVHWADTDWGLLKVFRGSETVLEFDRTGRAHFVRQFDIVRRNFDVVDTRTHITLHRIRILGEQTLDLTRK